MDYFKIFNQKLAGKLMTRGFVLQGLEPNPNGKFNVFLFKDSEELRKAIEEINHK